MEKWTKSVDIFSKQFVVFPVCASLHWSLIILCNPGESLPAPGGAGGERPFPFLLHFDSLASGHTKKYRTEIKEYLTSEWKAKAASDPLSVPAVAGDERDFSAITCRKVPVPKQSNGCDCGLFLLNYLQRFASGTDVPLTLEDTERRQGDLDVPFLGRRWFLPQEASILRGRILLEFLQQFKAQNEAFFGPGTPLEQALKDHASSYEREANRLASDEMRERDREQRKKEAFERQEEEKRQRRMMKAKGQAVLRLRGNHDAGEGAAAAAGAEDDGPVIAIPQGRRRDVLGGDDAVDDERHAGLLGRMEHFKAPPRSGEKRGKRGKRANGATTVLDETGSVLGGPKQANLHTFFRSGEEEQEPAKDGERGKDAAVEVVSDSDDRGAAADEDVVVVEGATASQREPSPAGAPADDAGVAAPGEDAREQGENGEHREDEGEEEEEDGIVLESDAEEDEQRPGAEPEPDTVVYSDKSEEVC